MSFTRRVLCVLVAVVFLGINQAASGGQGDGTMAAFKIKQYIDMYSGGRTDIKQAYGHIGDKLAHEWEITVVRNGAAADLSSHTATALVNNGAGTVQITATITGNVVSALLPAACYIYAGTHECFMRITNASDTSETITAVMHLVVTAAETDTAIDPGTDITTTLSGLLATEAARVAAEEDRADAEIARAAFYDGFTSSLAGKADLVSGATNGNFAGLDADGNLTDSGSKAADFATAADAQTKAITDTGSYFTTDTVEAALQEVGSQLAQIKSSELLDTHIIHELPNGVRDSFDYLARTKIKRISDSYVLLPEDIALLLTDYVNVDLVVISGTIISDSVNGDNTCLMTTRSQPLIGTFSDAATLVWKHYINPSNWIIIVPKNYYATLAAAQTDLTGTKINFQLATTTSIALPDPITPNTLELVRVSDFVDKLRNLLVEPEWITPTLLNGATGTLQYRKNVFGRLEFRGHLNIVSVGVVNMTLAAGYLPFEGGIYTLMDTYSSPIAVNITAEGAIVVLTTTIYNIYFDALSIITA